MALMSIYPLLFALMLSVFPGLAQDTKSVEAPNIPTVAFCDLVYNPDNFNGKEVRFRATYLSNTKVAAFADQTCMEKDKRTWVEFDGGSIKASAPPEMFERVEEQILCGKCGGGDGWRETEMVVRGVFHGDDTGHGRFGKYRFMVTVRNVEEMGVTVRHEKKRFDLR